MAELRFDGRVAVVTGAGGGLGPRYALDLAARGAPVLVNDIGCAPTGDGASRAPAEAVVDEIRSAGGVAMTLRPTTPLRS
jgi:NAD(P)-dependent dehydrogenase (short-subunit alcohol dehydrogenase family)